MKINILSSNDFENRYIFFCGFNNNYIVETDRELDILEKELLGNIISFSDIFA